MKSEEFIMFAGTVLSLIISFFFFYFHPAALSENSWNQLAYLIVGLSSLFLLIFTFVHCSTWSPLQNAEKNFTPHVLELFHADRAITLISLFLEIVPLLTFFIAFVLIGLNISYKLYLLAAWVVLFGITIDLTRAFIRRIQKYLNPYSVIEIMASAARASIRDEKELVMCDWMDGLAEIASKGIQRSNASLACQSVQQLQSISKNYLESSKSISHYEKEAAVPAGTMDKVSYILFYLYQRMEIINENAVDHRLESVCTEVISSLAKIAVYTAKFDISLTSYPVYSLGKCALHCQQHRMPEVGIKAILSLLEVAKTIIQEIDLTYQVIKDPFFSLITQMHEMSKEAFKQDKEVQIALLIQPFKLLKELFASEKIAQHPDTPEIVSKIDNVLAEFSALEMVLRTLPPIPQIPEDQVPPGVAKLA